MCNLSNRTNSYILPKFGKFDKTIGKLVKTHLYHLEIILTNLSKPKFLLEDIKMLAK